MEASSDICTNEDFEYFMANKGKLAESANERVVLKVRPADSTAGLINAGSTCYLNSVLQCLYQNAEFLKLLFEIPEAGVTPVVKELRSLFSFMRHSSRTALSTKDLLAAFGWANAQAHEQHDAHEFVSILLDALNKSYPAFEAQLQGVLQGVQSDITQCSDCNFEKATESNYQTISVDVPDNLEGNNEFFNLFTILQDSLKPETLDEDNRWECSGCSKKVCANRRHTFKTLPNSVVVQMKRFRFDPTTKKRRKLNTAVEFPEILPLHEIFQSDSASEKYILTGIVVHVGTAMGGHYKSYTRSSTSPSTWFECNDDYVSKLTPEEVVTLYTEEGKTPQIQPLLLENAYLLVYSKASSLQAAASALSIPVTPAIEADNQEFLSLVKLDSIKNKLVQCDIAKYTIDSAVPQGSSVTLLFPKHLTITEITNKIYEHFVSLGEIDAAAYPNSADCIRIRRFSNARSGKGETFGSRASQTLAEAGFAAQEQICFEIRQASDATFVEYNPNDMILHIHVWTNFQELESELLLFNGSSSSKSAASPADNKWREILVPGQEKATVQQFRDAVLSALNLAADAKIHLIPFEHGIPLVCLEDHLNEELRKKYKLLPGHHIVVEQSDSSSTESPALNELKLHRSRVRVLFNNPSATPAGNGGGIADDVPEIAYDRSVETTSDITLAQLKELIANQLNIPVQDFHLRRHQMNNSEQLKEESKSLMELEISDQSVIHVQMGKGCNQGEFLLRFELDIGKQSSEAMSKDNNTTSTTSRPTTSGGRRKYSPDNLGYLILDDIAINEKSTILQVKKLLFAQWTELVAKLQKKLLDNPQLAMLAGAITMPQPPASPNHIRLRDIKNTGKISGPLRDDRMICRCLLGIQDGRRIGIQLLSQEEIINSDDLLIIVKKLSYEKKLISEPYDICVPRTFTVKQLYDKITTLFSDMNVAPAPELLEVATPADAPPQFIDIAKGYTTGPPLTLKSAMKLKWYEEIPSFLQEFGGQLVDRLPFNLRDGSVLILRSKADWLKIYAKLKAKKEAMDGELEGGVNVVGVGAGVSAVRAARAGSARNLLSSSNSEPQLKIATEESRSSRPPMSKKLPPTHSQSGNGSPNENVNVANQ